MKKMVDVLETVIENNSLKVSDVLIRSNYTTVIASDGAGLTLAVTYHVGDVDVRTITVEDMCLAGNDEEFNYIDGDNITEKIQTSIEAVIARADD